MLVEGKLITFTHLNVVNFISYDRYIHDIISVFNHNIIELLRKSHNWGN